MRLKSDPSRRVRSELVYSRVHSSRSQNVRVAPIISAEAETDLAFPTTRHFVPGYLHVVPPGQKPQAPVHIFEATSLAREAVDDEDDEGRARCGGGYIALARSSPLKNDFNS